MRILLTRLATRFSSYKSMQSPTEYATTRVDSRVSQGDPYGGTSTVGTKNISVSVCVIPLVPQCLNAAEVMITLGHSIGCRLWHLESAPGVTISKYRLPSRES